ncbi:MAG: hypothetical protein JSV49_09255 [Thermoplasmata archaeon]|nr:MAG: hypothetical protein JSV49_09255 [Thermoplasmata archaeon]
MAIKSKIGRRRYIVFKIQSGEEITYKDLIFTFNRILPIHQKDKNSINENPPVLRHKLKYFDGEYGILLCPHWLKASAIEIIGSVQNVGYRKKPIKIETIGTSGTLKKARKKYLQ